MASVVMGLEHPHVWVASALVKTIAIRVSLGLQHNFVEFTHTKRAALTTREHLCFKQETTVNVDYHLRCADEVDVEQCQTLVALHA